MDISIKHLNECFKYDPETGNLIWRKRPADHFRTDGACAAFNRKFAGKIAGCLDKRGYRQTQVMGRLFFVHRIIWALVNEEWPEGDIDHINGQPNDNRLVNLRCVPHSENQRNLRRAKNNTTGVTGVSIHTQTGAFTAKIKDSGTTISLGCFKTIEEARAARQAAERVLGFHENHGRD